MMREIIPNRHNLGIVREIFIHPHDITNESNFERKLEKKYRYYLLMKHGEDYYVFTYNPEIKNKKQVKVLLEQEQIVHCQTMQTKQINIREILKEREVEDLVGTYTVYQMK